LAARAALRICDSLRFTKVSDLALAGRTPAQVNGAMLPPSPGKSSATLDSTKAFFAVKHRHQHLQGRKIACAGCGIAKCMATMK